MANVRIDQLPAITTIAEGDSIPIWDLSGTTTNKSTIKQIQEANIGASPIFAGLTLTSFSGIVKATAGVLSTTSLVDDDIPNTITLDNITQITNRSHTNLSSIGTNTHAQLDTFKDTTVPATYATLTNLSLHEAGTTSIHGIADTSDLALKSGSIAQFTIKSHTALTDIGTLTHATLDSYLDQAVKQASSPTFAGLTLPATGVISFGTSNSLTSVTSGSWPSLQTKTDTYIFGTASASAIPLYAARISGDTYARFTIDGGGMFSWGPGNGAGDLDAYRPYAGQFHIIAAGTVTPLPSILAIRPCWTGAVAVGAVTTAAMLYDYFSGTGNSYLRLSAKRNTTYDIESLAGGDGTILPIVFKANTVESFRIGTDAVFSVSQPFESTNTFSLALTNSTLYAYDNFLSLKRSSVDANSYQLKFLKTRGTGTTVAYDSAGDILFNFYNSTPAEKNAALIRGQIIDPTATSEDAILRFYTVTAGTLAEGLRLNNGTLYLFGDDATGLANTIGLTKTSDLTANSTGVGTILFKGATNRNSSGFIKIYVGTTAYYIPVFSAITG